MEENISTLQALAVRHVATALVQRHWRALARAAAVHEAAAAAAAATGATPTAATHGQADQGSNGGGGGGSGSSSSDGGAGGAEAAQPAFLPAVCHLPDELRARLLECIAAWGCADDALLQLLMVGGDGGSSDATSAPTSPATSGGDHVGGDGSYREGVEAAAAAAGAALGPSGYVASPLLSARAAVSWLAAAAAEGTSSSGSSGSGSGNGASGNGVHAASLRGVRLWVARRDVAMLCRAATTTTPSSVAATALPDAPPTGSPAVAATISTAAAIAAPVQMRPSPPPQPPSSWGARLRSLDLGRCHLIGDDSVAAVAAALPALTSVSLAGCWRVTGLNGALGELGGGRLRSLDVLGCWQALRRLPSLEALAVADCPSFHSAAASREDEEWQRTTALSPSQPGAALQDDAAPSMLPRLQLPFGLTKLDAQRSGMDSELLFGAATSCTALRDLRVSGCQKLSPGIIDFLLWLRSHAPHRADDADPGALSDLGMRAATTYASEFSGANVSQRFCALEVLHAAGLRPTIPPNGDDDSAGITMMGGRALRHLRSLDLSDSFLASASVAAAIAERCSALTALKMAGCRELRDSHVAALGRGVPTLQVLDLSGCSGPPADSMRRPSSYARTAYQQRQPRVREGVSSEGIRELLSAATAADAAAATPARTAAAAAAITAAATPAAAAAGPSRETSAVPRVRLRSLALADTRVSSALLASAEFQRGATALTSLDLRNCSGVDDDGVRLAIRHCPRLRSLRLDGTAVAAGVFGCYKMPPQTTEGRNQHQQLHPQHQHRPQEGQRDSEEQRDSEQQQQQRGGDGNAARVVVASALSHALLESVSLPTAACTRANLVFLAGGALKPLSGSEAVPLLRPLACMDGASPMNKLTLRAEHITDQDLAAALQRMPHLRSLKLQRAAHLTDATLRAAAANCRLLSKVSLLDAAGVTNAGMRLLLACLPTLEKLQLSQCPRVTDAAFHSLGCQHEGCAHAALGERDGGGAGHGGGARASLGGLSASGGDSGAGGAAQPLPPPPLPQLALKQLRLGGQAGVTDTAAAAVLRRCPSLEVLSLRGTGVTTEGAISVLRSARNLRELDAAARGVQPCHVIQELCRMAPSHPGRRLASLVLRKAAIPREMAERLTQNLSIQFVCQ